MGIYIAAIFLLTYGFAILTLRPSEMTEQFLKSGDSIENIHAGADTDRYLHSRIYVLCFVSALIMSVCMGVPMYLRASGGGDGQLLMLSTMMMMLTGMWSSVRREYKAMHTYDQYTPFL